MKMYPTPAPWLLQNQSVYALNERGTNRFSTLIQPGFSDGYERTGERELIANARLIAAAPDLLAALRAFMARFDFGEAFPADHPITAARAAIASATGEA